MKNEPKPFPRGLLTALLPVAALILLVVAALSLRRGDPVQGGSSARRAAAPQSEPGLPSRPSDAVRTLAPPPAPPTREVEMPKVARAMDLSNVRVLARALSEAAALEDRAQLMSMKGALRRYGALARPVLVEEQQSATDPKVLAALTEAIADAR